MGTIIFNIALICTICTFAIDITGGVAGIYNAILRLVFKCNKNHDVPKPFGCSVCSSFWTSIAYIIITNQLNLLNITIAIVLSALLPRVLVTINDVIELAISKLLNKMG